MFDSLLLVPRLVLNAPALLARTLDDVHQLAVTAQTLPEVEERLTLHIAGLEQRIDLALEQAGTLDRLEARAGEAIALARRLEQDLPDFDRAIASVDRLAAASVVLGQAVGTLQGAGERIGRLTDLLPVAARFR